MFIPEERNPDAILDLLKEVERMDPEETLPPNKKAEYATVLLNYCSDHFFQEEREMLWEGFPGLEIHRLAHEDLQDTLGALIRELLSQSSISVNHLANLIQDHFVRHILIMDESFLFWKRRYTYDPSF